MMSGEALELRLPEVPLSRVPESLEVPAARGFAGLWVEGWSFSEEVRAAGLAVLDRLAEQLWDSEPLVCRVVLENRLLSPARARKLLERMAGQDPERTADLLEYLHSFSGEELRMDLNLD